LTTKSAHAASGGPDISLAIDIDGGGDDCDTRPGTSAGAACAVPVGEVFVVKGNVDGAAGLPDTDGDTQHGYAGFQFRLLRSSGLSLNNPPGTDTELGFPDPFWPDCGSGRGDSEVGPTYDVVCFASGGESLYLGKVVEVAYTCSSPGVETVNMDDAGSYIHNDGHGNLPLDKEGNETITVSCTASTVGGMVRHPPVQSDSGANPVAGGRAISAELGSAEWIALGTAGTALTLAAAGLYARRSPSRNVCDSDET
jgi:hypothetical protein